LAFSPLAAGLLTGKYGPDVTPEGSRRSIVSDLGGRITPRLWPAIDAYKAVADKHGLNLTQMALAWCFKRPFMTSVICGATSLDQLQLILDMQDMDLSDDVMRDINQAHKAHPMPY
jgi:aryl-alcohol dehydrogenase-like predicted oxidoreductase